MILLSLHKGRMLPVHLGVWMSRKQLITMKWFWLRLSQVLGKLWEANENQEKERHMHYHHWSNEFAEFLLDAIHFYLPWEEPGWRRDREEGIATLKALGGMDLSSHKNKITRGGREAVWLPKRGGKSEAYTGLDSSGHCTQTWSSIIRPQLLSPAWRGGGKLSLLGGK